MEYDATGNRKRTKTDIRKRESESKYCLSVMNTEQKPLKWRASLFALGSFGYFCCQKYQNEFVSKWNESTMIPCIHPLKSYLNPSPTIA